jgi:hypothetical protein
MYALSAGAAGVTALALAQSAQAKIIYTPAHKSLSINHPFYLDFNHDGISDFKLFLFSSTKFSGRHWVHSLKVDGATQGNQIRSAGTSQGLKCAAALPKGSTVGPKSPFKPGYLNMFFAGSSFGGGGSYCPWAANSVRTGAYLGVKFSIKGKVHYGWARFGNINIQGLLSAELQGYAYETIPNKPIITGKTKGPDDNSIQEPNSSLTIPASQPATLGILALAGCGKTRLKRA